MNRLNTNPLTPSHVEQDPSNMYDPTIYSADSWRPIFARLRREDPVHFTEDSPYGPFWSLTRHEDILAVEWNDAVFSSSWEYGGTDINDHNIGEMKMFMRMDRPDHTPYRRAVAPIVGPKNLKNMTQMIRDRTIEILDTLPLEEEFNWVDKVSVPLTTMMLATLFDFPFEDRAKLTYWSDVLVSPLDGPGALISSETERAQIIGEMGAYFRTLYDERRQSEPKFDLLSMLAHSETIGEMDDMEFLGTLILLIVGGNDTTRNSMSGGLLAMHENPDQFVLLRENPDLVDNLVSEIIRYQTPLIQMRRTAREEAEIGGKKIAKGDKVVMWYVSGNRDEEVFPDAEAFQITRENARRHVAFGAGVHRCVGDRLAELQLKILWQEILARDLHIRHMGAPLWLKSNKIRGILDLPTVIGR